MLLFSLIIAIAVLHRLHTQARTLPVASELRRIHAVRALFVLEARPLQLAALILVNVRLIILLLPAFWTKPSMLFVHCLLRRFV
jgi:phage-related tail protein